MNIILYVIRNLVISVKSFYRNFLKAFISSIGIVFIISFLIVFISVRTSVSGYIGEDIFGQLAINDIIISRSGKNSLKKIDPSLIQKIKKMDEIEKIYTVTRLDYKTKIKMEMLGKEKEPHVPICGISKNFLKGKDTNWREFQYHKGGDVPVLAPAIALDLLNNFAASVDWPDFTESMLKGFPLGISAFIKDKSGAEQKVTVNGKLHGFTSLISFSGVLVPEEFIYDFARTHRNDSGRTANNIVYIKLFASVKDIKKLPEVTKTIKGMGLSVESRSDISQKTNRAMEVIDGIFLLVGSAIIILTVISIFNSYLIIVNNRSYSFSLKRVIGFSKLRIVLEFAGEAALIGLILGFAGYFFGFYCVDYISRNIGNVIPAMKGIAIIKPAKNLMLLSITFATAVSAMSALVPAVIASNINLFKSVGK
jgi:ABC-type lipoprotein release transport system permease subunit